MRIVTISPEAMRVMQAGFRERKPASIIAGLVKAATGETIAPRTIARRASEFRAEQSRRRTAREQVEDLVKAMRDNDFTAAEMIQALATQALIDDPQGFAGADPLTVQRRNLEAEEIRLKARKLDLQERAVTVVERRLAILEDREKKARAAADELAAKAGRGEEISPADLDRIRSIYGLGEDNDDAGSDSSSGGKGA